MQTLHLTIFKVDPTAQILTAVTRSFPTQSMIIEVLRLRGYILVTTSIEDGMSNEITASLDIARYIQGITKDYKLVIGDKTIHDSLTLSP